MPGTCKRIQIPSRCAAGNNPGSDSVRHIIAADHANDDGADQTLTDQINAFAEDAAQHSEAHERLSMLNGKGARNASRSGSVMRTLTSTGTTGCEAESLERVVEVLIRGKIDEVVAAPACTKVPIASPRRQRFAGP